MVESRKNTGRWCVIIITETEIKCKYRVTRIKRILKIAQKGGGGNQYKNRSRVKGMTGNIEIKRIYVEHRMLKIDSKEYKKNWLYKNKTKSVE